MSKKEEALEHIAKAEKCLKTSLFKRTPDRDGAIDEYTKAAVCFRNGRLLQEAVDVYLKIAELCKEQNSLFNEAKNMEQAALLLKDLKEYDRAYSLIATAANNYRLNGTPDSASIVLEKGAKMIEEALPEKAADLYLKSAQAHEVESKWRPAADVCGQAARMFVRVSQLSEAVKALEMKIHYCSQEGFECGEVAGRAVTALVLIHLAQEDAVAARRAYDSAVNSSTEFGRTDDAGPVGQLIQAFEDYDAERVKQILSTPVFRNLENDFVKLARNLKCPTLESGGDEAGDGKSKAQGQPANSDLADEVEENGLL